MKGRKVDRFPTATAPKESEAAALRSSEEEDSADVRVCCRFAKALRSVVRPISPMLSRARRFAEA